MKTNDCFENINEEYDHIVSKRNIQKTPLEMQKPMSPHQYKFRNKKNLILSEKQVRW